jgi:retron-type reverse transcriptase
VLANIYLHYALDLWFEKKVKPKMKGRGMLIRYADDFVVAFQFKQDAERFYKVLPRRLNKFGLEVAPEKAHLKRFSRFHSGRKRTISFWALNFIGVWVCVVNLD